MTSDSSSRDHAAAVGKSESRKESIMDHMQASGQTQGSSSMDNTNKSQLEAKSKASAATESARSLLSGCECSNWRTVALRMTLVTCLVVTAILCALISYRELRASEQSLGENTFEGISELALEGAKANMLRRLQGNGVMAQTMTFLFPDADDWPMASFDGYTEINRNLAKMSTSTEHALVPFVKPEQVAEFEAWAKQMFREHGYPETAGTNDAGFGIWKFDFTSEFEDKRARDVTGETSWGSPHKILTPILHTGHKSGGFELLNGHANPFYGGAQDALIDCAMARKERDEALANETLGEEEALHVTNTPAPTPPTAADISAEIQEQPPCSYLSDMFQVAYRDAAAAGVIYTPIYPKNDPYELVGYVSTTVFWEDILFRLVPSFISGLVAVISTDTQTYTFEVTDRKPTLLGDSDLHDSAYDGYARSIVLDDFETDAVNSARYTLTLYPSAAMFDEFQTSGPLLVSLGFLGAIALCMAVFLLYDLLMRYEVQRRNLTLQVKRRFVRFVSHEIRTPLNTVSMGLELLEAELKDLRAKQEGNKAEAMPPESNKTTDDDDDEPTGVAFCQQITEDVMENVTCAVDILNDLLNYDKVESGTLKLEIDKVPLVELLEKNVHQFQVQAANKNVEMILSIESSKDIDGCVDVEAHKKQSPDFVVGDHVRLGQCFRNILSNGLKFTPPKGKIYITLKHMPDGLANAGPISEDGLDGSDDPHPLTFERNRHGSFLLEIKDTGVGLAPHQLKQLFTEGTQFDANKLQHGGGSGLGLAITKGIIEQHRGSIWADSQGHGTGTSFFIELPVYEGEYCDSSSTTTTANSRSGMCASCTKEAPEPPKSRRILVVEDVHSSAKMLVRLLERAGHTCGTAANGELAVNAIQKDMATKVDDPGHTTFDTILMDFEMPVLNGPDATKGIREMGYQGIIFGVTGNLLQEDVEHFKSKGATAVVGKPISMKVLNGCWENHPFSH